MIRTQFSQEQSSFLQKGIRAFPTGLFTGTLLNVSPVAGNRQIEKQEQQESRRQRWETEK